MTTQTTGTNQAINKKMRLLIRSALLFIPVRLTHPTLKEHQRWSAAILENGKENYPAVNQTMNW